MRACGAISAWLSDRLGVAKAIDSLLHGQVARRGAWLRTTGFTCLVLFLVLAVTGILIGLFYSASPEGAYKSILALEKDPLGRFLRGLHHWSSAALILISGLTAVRMFFAGEYRGRRDVVWIAIILAVNIAPAFQLTGHTLPWDTHAIGTTAVEAGILGNLWGVGPTLSRLILGGANVGSATLSLWYALHVLVLPMIMLLLVAVPLIAHRLRSSDVQPNEPSTGPTDPYYPVHMAREMVVALGVFTAIVAMALLTTTPLEAEATPENLNGYHAHYEWYVLPLHGATMIPPFNQVLFEPIVTVVLPGMLVTALFLLPFMDRSAETSIRKRPLALAAGLMVLGSVIGLSVYSLMYDAKGLAPIVGSKRSPAQEAGLAPKPTALVLDTAKVATGKKAYIAKGCTACHAIGGKGGAIAPDLTTAGTRQPDRAWHIAHLLDPVSKVPGSTMPTYKHLPRTEVEALAEYMLSLR